MDFLLSYEGINNIETNTKQGGNAMKKVIVTVIVMVSLFSVLCKAQDYSTKTMRLSMNGHDYWIHDFISDTVNQIYSSQRSAIYDSLWALALTQGEYQIFINEAL
jgi:hypothetical protein